MTEHIQAFFASKKTQTISLLLGLLSLILTLVCFLAPLSRERWAIQSLGETTTQQLSPLSMSMAHYEPQRLRYLLATETTGPTYDKLIELLSQAKKEYGFSRLYLVYEKEDGSLACLADAAYKANKYANIMGPVNGNLGNISYVLCAFIGGLLALNNIGSLTLGTLASFLALNRSFYMPINQISMQLNSVIMAMAGAERVFTMMEEEVEEFSGEIPFDPNTTTGYTLVVLSAAAG